jgi:hypothetical protein
VEDPEFFPADQEIPMDILHTCFEMECTKVLFKNKIWTELLEMLPTRSIESRLHQRTIDANTCEEYLLKYFKRLDERSRLELNKSKEISLLVENAYNQNFGQYADVVEKILSNLDNYVEGEDEELVLLEVEDKKRKKVGFVDLTVPRAEDNRSILVSEYPENVDIIKNTIKQIHQGLSGQPNPKTSPPSSTALLQTSPKVAF